jgi:hypothetical protein
MASETKRVYQQDSNAAVCDHTLQHCYFADMAYETKHVYQQNSNAAVCPKALHCQTFFSEGGGGGQTWGEPKPR